MKKEIFKKGKYIAKEDTPILYTFRLGGGLDGRKVKKGETVTAIDLLYDVDTKSVCCVETLCRIELNYFLKTFAPLQ